MTYGIDPAEDDMIVLERTITNRGKSVCRINGKIVTLTILKQFGDLLVNIHSQHDNIHLMNPNTHIQLLDLYNQRKITPLKSEYKKHYDKLQILQQKYSKLNENEQQIAHRLDLLEFQLKEINDAALLENEDEDLMKERKQLQNYESIHRAIETSYDALYGEGKALEWIDIARKSFQDSGLDEHELIKYGEQLETLYFSLEEVTFEIRNYSDTLY